MAGAQAKRGVGRWGEVGYPSSRPWCVLGRLPRHVPQGKHPGRQRRWSGGQPSDHQRVHVSGGHCQQLRLPQDAYFCPVLSRHPPFGFRAFEGPRGCFSESGKEQPKHPICRTCRTIRVLYKSATTVHMPCLLVLPSRAKFLMVPAIFLKNMVTYPPPHPDISEKPFSRPFQKGIIHPPPLRDT